MYLSYKNLTTIHKYKRHILNIFYNVSLLFNIITFITIAGLILPLSYRVLKITIYVHTHEWVAQNLWC